MRKIWTLFMASTLFLSPIYVQAEMLDPIKEVLDSLETVAGENENLGIVIGEEGNPQGDNPEVLREELETEVPTPETESTTEGTTEEGGTTDAPMIDDHVPEQVMDPNKVLLTLDSTIVWLYGEAKELLLAPKVVEGRTYLPLRFVGEEILQAQVEWLADTRQVRVTKEGKEVVLSTTEAKAYVNGVEVEIEAMPIVEEGTTLLPLRFMAEQFELSIEYDAPTRTIAIEKPIEIPNTPPVAQFEFVEERYVAGQQVQTNDLSFDPDGHLITERLWMIDGNPTKTASSLEKIFKTPKQGYYEIALKVRDERGMWSDWNSHMIMIAPNEAPEVIEFDTTKSKYKRGEAITLEYEYENEEWEQITAEKWTYRSTKEAANNYLFTKPKAIYTEGEYIVMLELKDAYGNWSTKAETTVEVTGEVLQTEFEAMFNSGTIGDTLANFEGTNYQMYKEADAIYLEDTKGLLMMSNSPEVVSQKGLLYEDTLIGLGRVMFHHINNFDSLDNQLDKKRLVVIAKNNTEAPVMGTISKLTTKGPSDDVLFVGQQLLLSYLDNTAVQSLNLEPGAQQVIYDSQNKNWLKGQAISGMFDVELNGPVTFTVALLGQNDTLEDIPLMPRPDRDVHPRGTFGIIDKNIMIDLISEDEKTKLVIGKDATEWVQGYDALLNTESANRGNFGVNYHVTVTAKEDTAVILNPRGNMFKGAIKWEQDRAYLTPSAGYFPSSNRAAFMGIVKGGETRTFTYMLPNGSSAPVLFGFIPESEWGE
ncbi:copper amine oxidase N-terminal domain-containing protein [Niameybacter sp.]|uniref:copper amine oxidase N-terminal domain-containing protein n=1 Tax=Niameybacter sp. TaxID=2033640 RepID=UPI002FC68F97